MFWAECFVWNEIFAKMCFTKCVYVPVEASENVWKTLCKSISKLFLYVPRRLIFIGKIRPNWAYTRSMWAYTRSIWACTRCTWSVFSSVLWGWPTDWHISQKWAYTRSKWAYIRSKWAYIRSDWVCIRSFWLRCFCFWPDVFYVFFQNTVMLWVDPVFLRVLEHSGVLRNNLESSGMFRKTPDWF